MTNDQKRLLKDSWKKKHKPVYILNKTNVKEMFNWIDNQLSNFPCDHTLKYAEQWLLKNIQPAKLNDIIDELKNMGGYCDCEVVANCYEDYLD